MPAYPSSVPTAKLVAKYALMSQDGMDTNTQPDLSPIGGTITLRATASPPFFYRVGSDQALGLVMEDHVYQLDSAGELIDLDGSKDIDILATDSMLVTPQNFQWEVSFDLTVVATGRRFKLPTFKFYAPAGTTVDLVAVTPVTDSNGTPIIQGPAGPATRLSTGIITTLAPGSPVTASLRGPAGDQILDLGIPQGLPGQVFSVAGRTGAVTLGKGDVGLGNVDNTSDAAAPVSTAQQTALNLKANLASPTFTGTVGGITKAMVGLGNVDNTSDLASPVSTATQTALNAKANTVHGHTYGDISGTVPTSALPPLAVNETFPVATQAAMLALTAQRGDMAILSISGQPTKTFVLATDSPGTLADWKEIMAAGQILSVNGQTGAVVIAEATDTVAGLMSGPEHALVGGATNAATPGTVALRGAAGEISFVRIGISEAPTATSHATHKGYVDGQVATRAAASHGHAAVTTVDAGFMAAADKVKLDGIQAGATAGGTGGTGAVSSVAGRTGAVVLVKADVGLSAVDNTSDAAKPVSTATQTALNAKSNTGHGHTYGEISGTVPTSALPPLAINETFPVATEAAMLALTAERGDMAIRSDIGQTFVLAAEPASTLANWRQIMAAGQVQSVAGRTGVVVLAQADVGLGNVNNTADTAKPVSTAQQTALNLKANIASPTFTGTVSGVSKAMVGLSLVDNTADTAKPVSSPQQTALNARALKALTLAIVKYTSGAWQFADLAAATAAGIDPVQTIMFIGHPDGSAPAWARTGDLTAKP